MSMPWSTKVLFITYFHIYIEKDSVQLLAFLTLRDDPDSPPTHPPVSVRVLSILSTKSERQIVKRLRKLPSHFTDN
jgi:hypothetical protein